MPQSYKERRKRPRLVIELDQETIKHELKKIAANQGTEVRRLVLIALVAAYPELQEAVSAELSYTRAEVFQQTKELSKNAEAVNELEMELSEDVDDTDTPLIFED